MRDGLRTIAAAVLLFSVSSCAATVSPADSAASLPGTPSAESTLPEDAVPCHGAYVADVDTSVLGESTPERAAAAWATTPMAPDGAPREGWTAVDDAALRSGDWTVGVTPTLPGGWLVSGLGCGAASAPEDRDLAGG